MTTRIWLFASTPVWIFADRKAPFRPARARAQNSPDQLRTLGGEARTPASGPLERPKPWLEP